MATTADEVWQLLGELIASQKEAERLFQKNKLEAERRMQETERLLRESKEETDRRMQETDRRMRETDQQIRAVNKELGELGNRLGEFGSWQVRPAAVRLFRERGIAVRELSRDVSVDSR